MPIELRTRKGRPPRVVLDNNIVLAALMFGGGRAADLRLSWQQGRCRPMVCKVTLLDLAERLAHPRLGFSRAEQQSLLGEYLPYALKVRVTTPDRGGAHADPTGLPLVRLAMAGKAHALVTADHELLALADHFICPILTLDDFADTLAQLRVIPLPKPIRIALAA
jgi:predicted nucleic acid-binding protein